VPNKKALASMIAVLTVICGFLTATHAFAASKVKVLYSFCSVSDCADGELPEGGLVFGADGNLYGTAPEGGANGDGVVFELTPGTGGTWTEIVLYNFCSISNCADGSAPIAGLIFDTAGNLYGTTAAGGAYQEMTCGESSNCGTVFELSPVGDGTWTESVLHSFGGGNDGRGPVGGLVFDAAGNLYGTTLFGGATYKKEGTAFELTPATGGTWTETILHNFCSAPACSDGGEPLAGLIFDAAGNLYGTTTLGGSHLGGCGGEGCGVVFRLTPSGNGKWRDKTLHTFKSGEGGVRPQSGLILDAAGNLYGATSLGGAQSSGTIFELRRGKNGTWTEKILNNENGAYGSLVFDSVGDLYGTANHGGVYHYGSVFELTPGKDGKWTEKTLHSFNNNGEDGNDPYANLIFDMAGNLYSTTWRGGGSGCDDRGCGTVFEITP
jgi:uncharacterized repeat protein (TIGR03803 family)